MPTFTQIIDEVLSHQFSPSQYTAYLQGDGTSDRPGIINEGQRYITAQTDFREMEAVYPFTTVSGTAVVDSLPSAFQRVRTLTIGETDGSRTPLTQINRSELEVKPVSSGKPEFYCFVGSNLQVWPTPDAAYTLYMTYYRDPSLLTATSDVPEIPAKYHHILVTYALIKCFERENDYNSALYHKGRFDEDIMKCRGEVQYDSDDYSQPKIQGEGRTDILAPGTWSV